jgi:release factor glutamine methyltransferase
MISELLRNATQELSRAGIDSPALDARLLLQAALSEEYEGIMRRDDPLTDEETKQFSTFMARRAAHEPVSRIMGKKEFWSLDFKISRDTLDPRPASETVIETTLGLKKDIAAPYRILDLGTGSGCLLIALLKEYPYATGVGIDCSPGAIQIAKDNAISHAVDMRSRFMVGDWAQGVEEQFDIVVSNPPYIAEEEISSLAPEVREYDPMQALVGGTDGLACYRLITKALLGVVKPGGVALLEIGYTQADAVAAMVEGEGFTPLGVFNDLAGLPRVVAALRQD